MKKSQPEEDVMPLPVSKPQSAPSMQTVTLMEERLAIREKPSPKQPAQAPSEAFAEHIGPTELPENTTVEFK